MKYKRIAAYLLQELSQEEAERFEEQCFARDDWPDELESAEQDLIDAYLKNRLNKKQRLRFEENYLTTDARKARVLTANSLHQVLPPPPRPRVTLGEKLQAFWRRPWVPQAAVATVLLILGMSVLVPVLMRGRRPLQTYQRLDLAMSSADRATGVQPAKVTLPLRADALEIYLKLPEQSANAASYRVQWENVKDNLGDLQIGSRDGQSIVVVIPAYKLTSGKYALKLFRINADGMEQRINGNYFFDADDPVLTR